jgi:hypothetical protein
MRVQFQRRRYSAYGSFPPKHKRLQALETEWRNFFIKGRQSAQCSAKSSGWAGYRWIDVQPIKRYPLYKMLSLTAEKEKKLVAIHFRPSTDVGCSRSKSLFFTRMMPPHR